MIAPPSVCPARYATATAPLVLTDDQAVFLCLIDGTACWSSGAEAAQDFRARLLDRLGPRPVALPDMDQLVEIMTGCAAEVARVVRPDPEAWPWSFSVAAARLEGRSLGTAASGALAVLLRSADGVEVLHRPRRVVDRLVEAGQMSPEEARASEHRVLLEGPFVTAETPAPALCPARVLAPGDAVLIGGLGLLDHPAALAALVGRGDALALRDGLEARGARSAPTAVWRPASRASSPREPAPSS